MHSCKFQLFSLTVQTLRMVPFFPAPPPLLSVLQQGCPNLSEVLGFNGQYQTLSPTESPALTPSLVLILQVPTSAQSRHLAYMKQRWLGQIFLFLLCTVLFLFFFLRLLKFSIFKACNSFFEIFKKRLN